MYILNGLLSPTLESFNFPKGKKRKSFSVLVGSNQYRASLEKDDEYWLRKYLEIWYSWYDDGLQRNSISTWCSSDALCMVSIVLWSQTSGLVLFLVSISNLEHLNAQDISVVFVIKTRTRCTYCVPPLLGVVADRHHHLQPQSEFVYMVFPGLTTCRCTCYELVTVRERSLNVIESVFVVLNPGTMTTKCGHPHSLPTLLFAAD